MKGKFLKGMGLGVAVSMLMMNSEKSTEDYIKSAVGFVKKTAKKIMK